jgi:hypothetical protein
MFAQTVQMIWVAAGAVVTLVLVIALAYWAVQESRTHPQTPVPPPAATPDQDARSDPTSTV